MYLVYRYIPVDFIIHKIRKYNLFHTNLHTTHSRHPSNNDYALITIHLINPKYKKNPLIYHHVIVNVPIGHTKPSLLTVVRVINIPSIYYVLIAHNILPSVVDIMIQEYMHRYLSKYVHYIWVFLTSSPYPISCVYSVSIGGVLNIADTQQAPAVWPK